MYLPVNRSWFNILRIDREITADSLTTLSCSVLVGTIASVAMQRRMIFVVHGLQVTIAERFRVESTVVLHQKAHHFKTSLLSQAQYSSQAILLVSKG